MRSLAFFWYYFFLLLIIIAALMLGDFSGINQSSRILLGLLLVLLILNPLVFIWSVRRGLQVLFYGSREEDQLKAKFDYLARATHQLRTPLSAVKWTLNMLLGGTLGAMTAEQKKFLQQADESVARVLGVVNDWLALDYAAAHRDQSQVTEFNLNTLIDSVVFELSGRLKEREQTLTVERAPEARANLRLDPIKLSMVLENLLDNASKYTPLKGQIKLAVRAAPLEAAPPRLEIEVGDSGIGIPPAEQSKIFTQFARASNAATLAPRGSGLGLYIVKEIVAAQGGRVWFESEVGRGTTFHIAIPLPTAPLV